MIKVNTTITTNQGLLVPSGVVVDVIPRIETGLKSIDLKAYASDQDFIDRKKPIVISELQSMGFTKVLMGQELLDWLDATDTFNQINTWVKDFFIDNGFNSDDIEIIKTIE